LIVCLCRARRAIPRRVGSTAYYSTLPSPAVCSIVNGKLGVSASEGFTSNERRRTRCTQKWLSRPAHSGCAVGHTEVTLRVAREDCHQSDSVRVRRRRSPRTSDCPCGFVDKPLASDYPLVMPRRMGSGALLSAAKLPAFISALSEHLPGSACAALAVNNRWQTRRGLSCARRLSHRYVTLDASTLLPVTCKHPGRRFHLTR